MKRIRLAAAVCVAFFIFLTSSCIRTVTYDETKKIAESADYIRPQGQIPLWQTPLDDMVIESMTILPGNKLMVSTSALGKDRTLRNKEFLILDSSKGSILWRIPKKASIEYTYTLPVIEPIVIIEERSPKEVFYQALGPDCKSVQWEKRIKGGTMIGGRSEEQNTLSEGTFSKLVIDIGYCYTEKESQKVKEATDLFSVN